MNKTSKILGIIVFSLSLLAIIIILWVSLHNHYAAAGTGATGVVAATVLNKMNKNSQQNENTHIEQPKLITNVQNMNTNVQNMNINEQNSNKIKLVLKRDNNKKKGPGTLNLFINNEQKFSWECITGGNVLDSTEYGGLTPEAEWTMIEPIQMRKHPTSGKTFKFARIIPIGNVEKFKNRTFNIDKWPFMIHISGTSTGCIAILPHDWKECSDTLNEYWKDHNYKFTIKVENNA